MNFGAGQKPVVLLDFLNRGTETPVNPRIWSGQYVARAGAALLRAPACDAAPPLRYDPVKWTRVERYTLRSTANRVLSQEDMDRIKAGEASFVFYARLCHGLDGRQASLEVCLRTDASGVTLIC